MSSERSPASHASLAYRADIDGLRAVAVLLVLVFHFRLVPQGASGFLGVDVFFVISGYLITSIVSRQLAQDSFSLPKFYTGRIRRLAPPLVATLLLLMAAGSVLLFPAGLVELSRQVLATQLYVSNIYYWRTVNYFGLQADTVYLLHTWSLAVEEQFYLLYPALLAFVHRLGRRFLLPVVVACAGLSFALNLFFVQDKPEATFYLLPTRAFELLAGAIVALLPALSPRSRLAAEAMAWAGVALTAYAVLTHGASTVFPGTFALLPVAGAAALLVSGTHVRTTPARLLGLAPVVYVGKLSYSLYLVHWPIIVLSNELLGERYDVGLRTLSFLGCFALAAAFLHAIETPVRTGRLLSKSRALLTAYAAAVAVTGLAFVFIEQSHGAPGRFDPAVAKLAALVDDRPPAFSQCEYDERHPERALPCVVGDTSAQASWLVYGDSHAWALHPALETWLRQERKAAYFMFLHACPPVFGVGMVNDNGRCLRFNELAERVAMRQEVTHVMLVSTWVQAVEGTLTDHTGVLRERPEMTRLVVRKLGEGLDRLLASGKVPYVWEPLPGSPGVAPLVMARALQRGESPELDTSLQNYRATYAFLYDVLDARRDRVRRVAPTSILCKQDVCGVTLDGLPVYFDATHVTAGSQPHWARLLRDATSE